MNRSKLTPLSDAISAHVQPGMHLNFASTPSRSNAAVIELARRFKGTNPRFEISATGFHSTAHLLPKLRLGRRYTACFFGDNYPIPRPNDLYSQLVLEGAELQFWSLWTYVSALRAGALGQPYAVTSSLAGSTMGEDLKAQGMFHQVPSVEPGGAPLGLVKAMRPDITFVHAAMADDLGNVVMSAPYSEWIWGAMAARTGTIVTVEKIVPTAQLAAYGDAMPLPVGRILAVSEEPLGAHPQCSFAMARFDLDGYADDFEHYSLWRTLIHDSAKFDAFTRDVLDSADRRQAYRNFVGEARIAELIRNPSGRPPAPPQQPRPISSKRPPLGPPDKRKPDPDSVMRAGAILLVTAARQIAEAVKRNGHPAILAGIGQGFLASRMARLWLANENVETKVMVETGLFDLECGPEANEFLLSQQNIHLARRLTSVEHVLGLLTCGADNRCLGVVGAAQVDVHGNVNSTRVGPSRILVGSGGANDIASSASEVIVLTRCDPSRLVQKVDYITSPGWNVRHVVTDLCVFSRTDTQSTKWTLSSVYPALGGRPLDEAVALIRDLCPWDYEIPEELGWAPLISSNEMQTLYSLDPDGAQWQREK